MKSRNLLRTFSMIAIVLSFGTMSSVLLAQNTISFQYCNAIAAGGALGCALGENPIDCTWLQGIYDACIANATALATPTPPPPSPPTPCTIGIQPEARPAPGSRSKGGMSPRDQSSSVPCIVLVDPVIELQNQTHTDIVQDPQTLATLGTVVTGVAADSAARVVVRIYANSPGDQLTVNLAAPPNDMLGPPFGTLRTILPADGGQSNPSQVTVTAVSTSAGPMGFVLYVPPPDFSRGSTDDTLAYRTAIITAQPSATSANYSATVSIWRPPVILVHGLWGDVSDWNNFTPFLTDSRFSTPGSYTVHRANYNYPTNGTLSNSVPGYTLLLKYAHTNSLGFAYNAPIVLSEIQEAIVDFRQLRQAAAAQVDVVAHSMGGTVTRKLEYLSQYTDGSSFGMGNVHKLITIGTPHLGSPLAGQLIQDGCVQEEFASSSRFAIDTVTVGGQPFTGGVGDLQGDGFNDGLLSNALLEIGTSTPHEVPTMPIAATMIAAVNGQSNTSMLNCMACKAEAIRACPGSALAASLTPLGWPTVFGGQPSDAVVPLNSQLNGNLSGLQFNGIIHSAGLEDLDFTGPGELDPLSNVNPIQTAVIGALNLSINNSLFTPLP